MPYKLVLSNKVSKQLSKFDKYTRTMILSWIEENLQDCKDPRWTGKPLTGNFKGQWRYRIGDYRLICIIEDDVLLITAIRFGHRKHIYE